MESSALHSLTKQKLLLAGKGPCVIPRRNPLEQLGSAPAHPHLPSRHSLLQPEHHFPGRDIQPRLRSQNPREFAASLLAEPFQRLHVPTPLVWKNRMEKETLGVSLMLMDFKAVRHLRGWDKEEGSRKSPSSAPYTQFRCRASPALSVAQSCVKPNYCPELSPPDFHNQKMPVLSSMVLKSPFLAGDSSSSPWLWLLLQEHAWGVRDASPLFQGSALCRRC